MLHVSTSLTKPHPAPSFIFPPRRQNDFSTCMTWSQGVMSWGHSSLLSDVLFLYPKRANIKQIYVSKFSLISELTLNGAIVPCSKSNILTLFISLVKTGIHPIFISFSLVDLPASHRLASIPVVSFFHSIFYLSFDNFIRIYNASQSDPPSSPLTWVPFKKFPSCPMSSLFIIITSH